MKSSDRFRPDRHGAAVAHLYLVAGFEESEPARLVADSDLFEAVRYLAKAEPEFRIRYVEHRGIVVMLSGSPHF